jgi:exodeoxyribonuclease V beta subunit
VTTSSTAIFTVDAPLPADGITLIQASAGTGKTYALAALTVRFVAERDVPISKVLLVTFTRAATAELRDRIRKRLVEAADHLADPTGATDGEPDPLLAAVADCTPDERNRRLARLRQAVRDFDTATISTIHGFCSQVRASMGVLSPDNTDAVPAESEGDLILQVCSDLVFGELDAGDADPLAGQSMTAFTKLVAKARSLSDSVVRAESAKPEDLRLVELVQRAVAEIDARLLRSGGLSFDSLLSSVRAALRVHPELVEQLRSLYDVALIDEFQDTDSVQWEIFRTVFGAGGSTLVLVGDPKQAIYAFRGGDVYTYLDAKRHADVLALGTNQRSDAAVVAAMNALGEGQVFGEQDIDFQQVEVAERLAGRRLRDADGAVAPGLVVRCVCSPEAAGAEKLDTSSARRRIAADVADVAAGLLNGGKIDVSGKDPRPVTAGMVAVLVGATADAAPISEALRRKGIPAVLRLKDHVASSPAHDQWRTLLWALERPASTQRATAAALTWFFGWAPDQIAAAIERLALEATTPTAPEDQIGQDLVALQRQLVEWSELLAAKGLPALLGEARRANDLLPRLLAEAQGERNLTDLEHLAELVHAGARTPSGGMSASAALAILDGLSAAPADEVAADSAQRRIESDADAVQIMTIHGAKGLEFPVVLLPFLWSGGRRVQPGNPYSFYDASLGRRVLDVSTGHDGSDGRPKRQRGKVAPQADAEARRQACGDQHRMTYVALTRAVHQSVVWWAPCGSGGNLSGLARLIFGAPDGGAADAKVSIPKPQDTASALQERVASLGAEGSIRVVEITGVEGAPGIVAVDRGTDADADLVVAELGRPLERQARFWSFSSLGKLAGAEAGGVGAADPTAEFGGDAKADDEASDEERPDLGEVTARGVVPPGERWQHGSPFEGLGAGKDFGNLVHDVFEHLDFQAPDPAAAVSELLATRLARLVPADHREGLSSAVAGVLTTPLGPAFGNRRLADVGVADRLAELRFYLPLSPGRPVDAMHIGQVVHDHLPDRDPLRPWAERLARGLAGIDLEGYLNGSIDLTMRFDLDGEVRYSVLDYKTNNLTRRGHPAVLADYRSPRLAQEMAHANYALQAVIYAVALHRYLRWRMAGSYDPARHLGPVGYLFVRGMIGPDTPMFVDPDGGSPSTPAGVFTWDLSPALVEAVSDLFAGDDGNPT